MAVKAESCPLKRTRTGLGLIQDCVGMKGSVM